MSTLFVKRNVRGQRREFSNERVRVERREKYRKEKTHREFTQGFTAYFDWVSRAGCNREIRQAQPSLYYTVPRQPLALNKTSPIAVISPILKLKLIPRIWGSRIVYPNTHVANSQLTPKLK